MLKESLALLTGIAIVGFSYYFANKNVKENERLEEENSKFRDKIRELETESINLYLNYENLKEKCKELGVENEMNGFKIRTLENKIKNNEENRVQKDYES